MGAVIIILGIILIIARKNKRHKKKNGPPGLGSPSGNVNVMTEENSSVGETINTFDYRMPHNYCIHYRSCGYRRWHSVLGKRVLAR